MIPEAQVDSRNGDFLYNSCACTPVPPAPLCLPNPSLCTYVFWTRQSTQRDASTLDSPMEVAITTGYVASGSGEKPRTLPSWNRQRAWRFGLHAAWKSRKKQHPLVISFKTDLYGEIVCKTTPIRSIGLWGCVGRLLPIPSQLSSLLTIWGYPVVLNAWRDSFVVDSGSTWF